MSHSILLKFADGRELTIGCDEDETIIDAGLRQNTILVSQCRAGVCASCKGQVIEGDYILGQHTIHALSPREEEEELILTCQTYPQSDMVIEYPYEFERVAILEPVRFPARVTALKALTPNVVRIVWQAEAPSLQVTTFTPGQYMNFQVPGTDEWRSWSMANPPNFAGELEFFARLIPGGLFSEHIRQRTQVGDIFELEGPYGAFYRRASDRAMAFVAGSTGLAPILAMLRHMAQEKVTRPVQLFFGVTNQEDLFFTDELNQLKQGLPQLEVKISIVNPKKGMFGGWKGETGLVTEAVKKYVKQARETDFYLCGPPAMIEAMIPLLRSLGAPDKQIFTEKFTPSGKE